MAAVARERAWAQRLAELQQIKEEKKKSMAWETSCDIVSSADGFIRVVVVLILMASSFVRTSMVDPRTSLAAFACNSLKAVSTKILADNCIRVCVKLSNLINQNGFGTAVAGEGPYAVFGLALCYRDLSSTDCKLCATTVMFTIANYYPKVGARIFFDGCLRYENFSFFNQGTDSVNFVVF